MHFNSYFLTMIMRDNRTVEIVGAVKLMDGLFLGDAICAEVKLFVIIISHFSIQRGN